MEFEDHCEICGQPSQVVEAVIRLPNGNWLKVMVHIACENNRMAKMRAAGMQGMN
jgi:hypothetical protein